METKVNIKKHHGREDLIGEHKIGDIGQIILLIVFLFIWIGDSFIFNYSTSLSLYIPFYIRLGISLIILYTSFSLSRKGLKIIFGEIREKPEIIKTSIYKKIRHPVYTGAILLYFGLIVFTVSILSAVFWFIIIGFYYYISKYEEKILINHFGDDYRSYKNETGMWFPKIMQLNRN